MTEEVSDQDRPEGAVGPDELVDQEAAPPVEEGTKSPAEVAQEVVAGHWGRGNARTAKLEAAGYDPAAVEEEVKKIFNQ